MVQPSSIEKPSSRWEIMSLLIGKIFLICLFSSWKDFAWFSFPIWKDFDWFLFSGWKYFACFFFSWKYLAWFLFYIWEDFTWWPLAGRLWVWSLSAPAYLRLIKSICGLSTRTPYDNNFNLCNCCLWPMRSMFSFSTAIMSPERPRGSTQSMLNRVGRLRRGTCRG